MKPTSKSKRMIAGGALILAGFGAGTVIAVTGSASAATNGVADTVSAAGQKFDPTKSIRPDEHLLSGTTASRVQAAALKKYPNATIQRVETDSDGEYEAHIVTTSGEQVIVMVGKDFTVTGTQSGGGPGGPPPAGDGSGT